MLTSNKTVQQLTIIGICQPEAATAYAGRRVGAGAQAEVSEKIRTLGADLLLVMPGPRNSDGARLEAGTQTTLTEEDATAIRRELVEAQVSAPLLSRSMPLVAANKNWVTLVAGVNADYLVARERPVADGRSFTGDEIASGAKVAIVGS
jgi:putative ABC transport system permease protein